MNTQEEYEIYLSKAQYFLITARKCHTLGDNGSAQKYYMLAQEYFDLADANKPKITDDDIAKEMAERLFDKQFKDDLCL